MKLPRFRISAESSWVWINGKVYDSFFNGRSLDVFVIKLRRCLKDDPQMEIINISGIGYQLTVKDQFLINLEECNVPSCSRTCMT